ncbi:pentapeptide repeat-containing protein [Pseudanabaena sp. FACHB-1998]|uniref:pentapeptide repeat-containing protein n=1 Tax=Pseudanabaena sp. FACHB-1998 TaxID=2692858 RepID=UPI0016818777|nr:pentapeptide repeat-containing protein [Pseudanabaena sp. FACHB-1998]MBD2178812.1 pentapeptide repeat-containing protein [Pseudanabaena sp. FACHB-1998]
MQDKNYRYQDFYNQSFQEELRIENPATVDFTGARLTGCDFQNTNLTGADFSKTEIKHDYKKIQSEISQIALHILWGIPLGWLSWQLNYVSFGCGMSDNLPNLYGWFTNPLWIVGFGAATVVSSRWMFLTFLGLISLLVITSIILSPAVPVMGIIIMVAAFVAALFGIYLGYRKGSISIGMIWIAVGVSSAISSGYSWLRYQEIHFALLFAALAILPAALATQAFTKHLRKVKSALITSFDGADLTKARFINADLENCDFTKANLTDVDWHGATFKNCKFPKNWAKDDHQAIASPSEYALVLEKL